MIREVSEKLEKEQQKAAAVNKDLGILRKAQDTAKQELEKIKAEYNSLSDKYKYQSRAYGKLSEVSIHPIGLLFIQHALNHFPGSRGAD